MRALPSPAPFPTTHWSVIARADRPNRLDHLLDRYWRPIFVFIRAGWSRSHEEAEDLTQEFLTRLVESDLLREYERERGRFRTYLKGALRFFLLDRKKAERCVKRGRGQKSVPLDEAPVPAKSAAPDILFDRAWARALLDRALENVRQDLRRDDQEIAWTVFAQYELESDSHTYEEIAERLGLTVCEVQGRLKFVRLLLREALRREAADTVGTEEELRRELKELFGR